MPGWAKIPGEKSTLFAAAENYLVEYSHNGEIIQYIEGAYASDEKIYFIASSKLENSVYYVKWKEENYHDEYHVIKYDVETHSQLWLYFSSREIFDLVVSPIDDSLYILDSSYVFKLSATGSFIWNESSYDAYLAVSPDGTKLYCATLSFSSTLKVLETTNGNTINSVSLLYKLKNMTISLDGTKLYGVDDDNSGVHTIREYDISSNTFGWSTNIPTGFTYEEIRDIAIDPDENRLYLTTDQENLFSLDPSNGSVIWTYVTSSNWGLVVTNRNRLSVTNNGKDSNIIYCIVEDEKIIKLDKNGTLVGEIWISTSSDLTAIEVNNSNWRKIDRAYVKTGEEFRIWITSEDYGSNNNSTIREFNHGLVPINVEVDILPDDIEFLEATGDILYYSTSYSPYTYMRFFASGETRSLSSAYSLLQIKISPDNRYLYLYGTYRTIQRYNVRTGELIEKHFAVQWDMDSLEISPDGSKIYVAMHDSNNSKIIEIDATLDSTANWEWIAPYKGFTYNIYLAISPDGSKLYATGKTSSYEDILVALDTSNGSEVNRHDEHNTRYFEGLEISSDGSKLYMLHYRRDTSRWHITSFNTSNFTVNWTSPFPLSYQIDFNPNLLLLKIGPNNRLYLMCDASNEGKHLYQIDASNGGTISVNEYYKDGTNRIPTAATAGYKNIWSKLKYGWEQDSSGGWDLIYNGYDYVEEVLDLSVGIGTYSIQVPQNFHSLISLDVYGAQGGGQGGASGGNSTAESTSGPYGTGDYTVDDYGGGGAGGAPGTYHSMHVDNNSWPTSPMVPGGTFDLELSRGGAGGPGAQPPPDSNSDGYNGPSGSNATGRTKVWYQGYQLCDLSPGQGGSGTDVPGGAGDGYNPTDGGDAGGNPGSDGNSWQMGEGGPGALSDLPIHIDYRGNGGDGGDAGNESENTGSPDGHFNFRYLGNPGEPGEHGERSQVYLTYYKKVLR